MADTLFAWLYSCKSCFLPVFLFILNSRQGQLNIIQTNSSKCISDSQVSVCMSHHGLVVLPSSFPTPSALFWAALWIIQILLASTFVSDCSFRIICRNIYKKNAEPSLGLFMSYCINLISSSPYLFYITVLSVIPAIWFVCLFEVLLCTILNAICLFLRKNKSDLFDCSHQTSGSFSV